VGIEPFGLMKGALSRMFFAEHGRLLLTMTVPPASDRWHALILLSTNYCDSTSTTLLLLPRKSTIHFAVEEAYLLRNLRFAEQVIDVLAIALQKKKIYGMRNRKLTD